MRPILITGTPKSGTSFIAAIIAKHGVFGGNLQQVKSATHPIGLYENLAIRKEFTRPYLRSIGADPRGRHPLPNLDNVVIPPPVKYKLRLEKCLMTQGWNGNSRWFLKEPKFALMWRVLHNFYPNAQWIVVRRKDKDAIRSCKKTSFIARKGIIRDWDAFIRYHKDRFREIREVADCAEVWVDDLKEGTDENIQGALKWLGIWTEDSSRIIWNTFRPQYWHNTA